MALANNFNFSTEKRLLQEKIDDQEKALETKDNELSQLRSPPPKARRVDIKLLDQFRTITPADSVISESIPIESPGIKKSWFIH